jgi:hypothetical protein
MTKKTESNTITFRITSARPLLMQSETLANPLSVVTKTHKAVAGKRKKSEDDYLWLLRSEWAASMYHDAALGPYIPAVNIEACIAEAAKASKQGKLVKQAVSVLDDRIPLRYEGPRDIDSLYGDGSTAFVDVRGVNVGGRKVMRARPLFREWAAEFTVGFMADLIDAQDIQRIVEHAGRVIGIGTFRPRFGRFNVESAS